MGPHRNSGPFPSPSCEIPTASTACAIEIVDAVDAGKLHYRLNSTHGNPWFRLLRSEVEELVKAAHGDQHLRQVQARAELVGVNRELKRLRAQLAALEERRAALIAGLASSN